MHGVQPAADGARRMGDAVGRKVTPVIVGGRESNEQDRRICELARD